MQHHRPSLAARAAPAARVVRTARALVLLLLAATAATACKSKVPEAPPPPPPPVFPGEFRVVDMTRAVDGTTPHLPTLEGFRYERISVAHGPGDRREGAYSLVESTGTHLTAPAAYVEGAATVDAVRAAVVHPLVVLRISAGAAGALPIAALQAFENEHGRIPSGAVVVLSTGMAARTTAELESGLRTGPGFGADAVRFLATQRAAFAIGTDRLAIDDGAAVESAAAARAAAEAGLVTISALTALRDLPETGAYVVLAPVPLAGAGAAPVRALAFVPAPPPAPEPAPK